MEVPDPRGSLATLVSRARGGEQDAWDAIVERFLPLVESVVRRHRLTGGDGDDVCQTVWLRLVEHLDDLREPEALPGWLRTTARHECLRLLAARGRSVPVDPHDGLEEADAVGDVAHVGLLRDEVAEAVRVALADLPEERRRLLLLLLVDPPLAYAEIGARLGIPVGGIGPTRSRILAQLRRDPRLRGLALEQGGGAR